MFAQIKKYSYLCAMKDKFKGKSIEQILKEILEKADEVIRVLKGNNK